MVKNETKMCWNWDNDKEKQKYYSKTLTATMQASPSICEITGFETRTRDTRTPPPPPTFLRGPQKQVTKSTSQNPSSGSLYKESKNKVNY